MLTVEVLVPRPLDHFRADGYTLVPRALEYPIPADLAARWDDTPSTAVLLVRSSAPPVAVVQTLTSVRWSSNRAAQVSVAPAPGRSVGMTLLVVDHSQDLAPNVRAFITEYPRGAGPQDAVRGCTRPGR
ncbi:MAG: hypothetical protein PGN13_16250 [Patulibacter minatonensis]